MPGRRTCRAHNVKTKIAPQSAPTPTRVRKSVPRTATPKIAPVPPTKTTPASRKRGGASVSASNTTVPKKSKTTRGGGTAAGKCAKSPPVVPPMEQVDTAQQDAIETAAQNTREISMAREHLLKVEACITTLCDTLDLRFEKLNDQLATLTTLIENGSSPQQQTQMPGMFQGHTSRPSPLLHTPLPHQQVYAPQHIPPLQALPPQVLTPQRNNSRTPAEQFELFKYFLSM